MAGTTTSNRPGKSATAVPPARRRYTVAEYSRMAEAGILRPEERIELLDGEIMTIALTTERYREWHPRLSDVVLIIQVSETSLACDRDPKLPRYDGAGIPEVCIADLGGRLLVYRDPPGAADRSITTIGVDGAVTPRAFPDLSLTVANHFGAISA